MPSRHLEDRAVIRVSGEAAGEWLQGLVSCGVTDLPVGEARPGALLTPQGKILFDFLISRDGRDAFRLETRRGETAALAKRLSLYRLRARVMVEETADTVAAIWDERPPDGALIDRRAEGFGFRLYGAGASGADDYEAHRLAYGIPEAAADIAWGETFPHEALMDMLGGVDFKKGCYVGQEVVSRMQHRGTARTRLTPVTIEGSAPPGTPVMAGDRAVGAMASSAGGRGLALLRLDRAAEAQAPLMAGAARLTPTRPVWWTAEWPLGQP